MKEHFNNKQKFSKKDIENLSCFFYDEKNGLLATAFAHFPLPLKRHCVQVGTAAGLMAMQAPESAVPEGMTRGEYANAVRYGSLYHDIGAYLVYNQSKMYPTAGARFLSEQISEFEVTPVERRVILETVRYCGERNNGKGYPDKLAGEQIPLHAGICAIADAVDEVIAESCGLFVNLFAKAENLVFKNKKSEFSPQATACFIAAYSDIVYIYQSWKEAPPFWNNSDIKPLCRPIQKAIG